MRGLDGKVMVVAGGAGGIGAASSMRLAHEGAAVLVADIDGADAERVVARIRDEGGRATPIEFDISDEEAVVSMFEAVTSAYGGLDGVHVNAADISGSLARDSNVVEIDLDVFDRTIAVNLRGHLLVTRHAIPLLVERGGGGLAYTSSGAAFVGGATRPSYAMAKAGIHAIVRHVATRWGKEGIRANAVAPGLVVTDHLRASYDAETLQAFLDQTRTTRLGRPDDIAAMIAFLLSDDGSWITGQVISVDGGATMR